MTFDPADGIVVVEGLTKRFGVVTAVDQLSFTVTPGRVTGFLGPNGAGKTTTLRLLLGLATPDAGTVTIGGIGYGQRPRPAQHVGAALEAASFHPGRTARDHLRVYAPEVGVPDSRCDEVLTMVGLSDAANRRVGGFSLGMRQRLLIAAALLGDKQILLFDEPTNALDEDGQDFLARLLLELKDQGKTILVSSHDKDFLNRVADHIFVYSEGKIVKELEQDHEVEA